MEVLSPALQQYLHQRADQYTTKEKLWLLKPTALTRVIKENMLKINFLPE